MISENKTKTVQVRVSETDHKYLIIISKMVGMTPSQYVRSLIQATVNAARIQEQKGALKVEDFEAILDD
jgi:hypothetical protein